MPLGRVAHRQHVVGERRRLATRSASARRGSPTLLAIGQRLHPAEAVGVGPDRVVDAARSRPRACRGRRLSRCGSRIDISLVHSGYSGGQSSSFQRVVAVGGTSKPCAMNLFQPLGEVPPSVPTLPVSTLRKNRRARHLPAAEVAGRRGAPDVCRAARCRRRRRSRRARAICSTGTPRLLRRRTRTCTARSRRSAASRKPRSRRRRSGCSSSR